MKSIKRIWENCLKLSWATILKAWFLRGEREISKEWGNFSPSLTFDKFFPQKNARYFWINIFYLSIFIRHQTWNALQNWFSVFTSPSIIFSALVPGSKKWPISFFFTFAVTNIGDSNPAQAARAKNQPNPHHLFHSKLLFEASRA